MMFRWKDGFKKIRCVQILLFLIWANSIKCATIDPKKHDLKLFQRKACQTNECKKIAEGILEKMDRNVKPCDDFYEFVCGNFSKNAIIPDDQSYTSLISQIRKKVQEELRASIENEITESDPRSFKILQSYYNICMNEDQVEKNSENEFRGILKRLGDWPVLAGESWRESSFDWIRTMYKFRETGFSFGQFFSFGIDADLKNNTRRIIYLDQASLGTSQEYLSKGPEQEIVKAYFKYMLDLAEIFGAKRERAKKELTESLNFEIDLAKISLSTRDRRDIAALYNPMTLNELQDKFSFVPWREYMNRLMSPYARLMDNEIVVVTVPSFFENLEKLIEKTPKRVLANYAYWRIVKQSASTLSERVLKAGREFSASLSGNNNKKPRWKDCVSQVSSLHLATGALYIRRNFNKNSKDSALEMISELKKTFRQMLTGVDWMEGATKIQALGKLDDILPLIAYPDELLDDNKLDNYYKDLTIYPNSYLKTLLSFRNFATKLELEQLRKPVLKDDWTGNYGAASIVNAFYEPSVFPAGIFQGAFFDAEHPKYMNYAGIGSIIGHEITHGFDDQGRTFDRNGNMVDWWDSKTEKEYLKKSKCIVNQYSSYVAKEVNLNVDGSLTQGENIADNGGLKQAYYAYDAWQQKNGKEPYLPGFESFTPEQMFWISYANVWCTKYRPEFLSDLMTINPHSPANFRVTVPISNMPEFSKDFNCPVGSAMNPTNRCSVW